MLGFDIFIGTILIYYGVHIVAFSGGLLWEWYQAADGSCCRLPTANQSMRRCYAGVVRCCVATKECGCICASLGRRLRSNVGKLCFKLRQKLRRRGTTARHFQMIRASDDSTQII